MPTQLGDLLERVYALADAAEPDWPGTLDALARHVGGAHGQATGGTPATGGLDIAVVSGIDPAHVRAWVEEHAFSDPRNPLLPGTVGRVFHGHEVEPPGFDRHPMVRDVLDRFGVRRSVGFGWSPGEGRYVYVGALRSRGAGAFDAADAARLGEVAGHFARAYALREARAGAASLRTSIEAGLAALPRPLVLVDGRGRASWANPAAEDLFRRGVLTRRGGALTAGDEAARGRFDAALAHTCHPAGAPGAATVLLHAPDPRAPGGHRRHAAAIGGLPAGHPWRAVAPLAVACVRVAPLDAGPAPAADPRLLAELFGLTPREARLAAHVGAGGSLEDAARAFGVSRHTLRAQLQAVFDKTGARRQAELVRLAQGLASLGG